MSPAVHQTEHGLLCEALREFLVGEVASSRGPGGCGGAGAALYSLLTGHPVDRRGRCRSCRDSGWWGRRRRVCMVFLKTHYWLRQPTHAVITHLASEWGVDVPASPDTASPENTEVLPKVVDDPPTDRLQTPAVSSPLPPQRFPRAGRPDPTHGGTGVNPTAPGLAVFHPSSSSMFLTQAGRCCSPEA